MNLVKAQRMAEGLPIPKLQEYVDGLNPSLIPPWVATGVMQAKTKAEEMERNMQGAAQGPQPSVKEQVEQKAGLMALQMAQQQGVPGQIPANIPQPQAQPQPQAGLDQLPSNIQMAGGGIVAFSGPTGSAVKGKDKDEDDESSQFVRDIAKIPQTFDELKQRAREEDAIKAAQDRRMEQRKQEMLEARQKTSFFNYLFGSPTREKEGLSKLAELSNSPLATTAVPAPAAATVADPEIEKLKRLAATPKPPVGQGVNTNVSPSLIPANLRPAVKPPMGKPPMAAPAATPNVPAAPAAPAPDSMEAMFRQALGDKPKERTIEEQLAEQKAIRMGAGLDEEAGKNKLARIAALNQQFESTKPTGLQELIQMFGQAGQYKGLSGLAPAYTGIEAQKRAANLAHAKQINELMGAVEDTQRGEKTTLAGEVNKGREKDLERGAQFGRERLQGLGSARGQDLQAGSSKYNADMHYKSAMAQLGAADKRSDMAEKRDLINSFKVRLAALDRELVPLEKSMMSKDKDLAAGYRAEKAGLMKALDEASGISKMMPAPSAASPSGTSLKYNPKTGKIE